MPRTDRVIRPSDLLSLTDYEKIRAKNKADLLPRKQNRRVEVGPFATFYFENYDTIWHQIHEMLRVEKGGAAQAEDELAAYNPLIPQGRELIATFMIEINDPVRRAVQLARLGGIEDTVFLDIGGDKVYATSETDVERTSPEGKTSSVHFLHFPLTEQQIERFKDLKVSVMLGIEHAQYAHMAGLSVETRLALAEDFN